MNKPEIFVAPTPNSLLPNANLPLDRMIPVAWTKIKSGVYVPALVGPIPVSGRTSLMYRSIQKLFSSEPGGWTSTELTEALKLPPTKSKAVAAVLRRMSVVYPTGATRNGAKVYASEHQWAAAPVGSIAMVNGHLSLGPGFPDCLPPVVMNSEFGHRLALIGFIGTLKFLSKPTFKVYSMSDLSDHLKDVLDTNTHSTMVQRLITQARTRGDLVTSGTSFAMTEEFWHEAQSILSTRPWA